APLVASCRRYFSGGRPPTGGKKSTAGATLNAATLLFARQPLAHARGSEQSRDRQGADAQSFMTLCLVQQPGRAAKVLFRDLPDGSGLELLASSEVVADHVARSCADVAMYERAIRVEAGRATLTRYRTTLGIDLGIQ